MTGEIDKTTLDSLYSDKSRRFEEKFKKEDEQFKKDIEELKKRQKP